MKKMLLLLLVVMMVLTASCGGALPGDETLDTETDLDAETETDDPDPAANDAGLSLLKIDGIEVVGFTAEKTEYQVSARKPDKVTVAAVPTVEGATVEIQQGDGEVTVTVTSKNGKNQKVYHLNVFERLNSKVVNKNGANAIVTYVIDDGDKTTATFVTEKMAAKYPSLSASFAIPTKNLATFLTKEGEDGILDYVMDEYGGYMYDRNMETWNFWKTLLDTYGDDGFEAVSHSHTHKYWGENDEGGTFEYKLSDGTVMTSEVFPRGNVTKEFYGSRQILQDLSQRALVFVRTGLSVNGKMVKYSDTFWKNMEESGAFIGARGTYTYPDTPEKMINHFDTFDRFMLKSYMVQHYNTNPAQKTEKGKSTPQQCLAAGIPYWTNYIDTAVENDAWAAFCIHTIRPDTYVGSSHYIFESQADALFAYTEKLSAENKVWVANLTDAYLYVIERESSTVDAYADDKGNLSVSLSCRETEEFYNVPLTVRVELPEGKTGAELDGKELTTVTEKGTLYVYVDVAPGETVVLTTK